MRVKISDLTPNPFRDIENYPFDEEKLAGLRNSIKELGFWDNILGRRHPEGNGKVQIAYGHHRLKILQEDFKPEDTVNIPVKELNDETMIKIMANENMEHWRTQVAIVDETIKVARNFLIAHPEILALEAKVSQPRKHRPITARNVAEFLGGNWRHEKVNQSLLRLEMIENGTLSKRAVESLPIPSAAEKFTRQVKITGLDKKSKRGTQRKIAKAIVETGDYSEEGIEAHFMEVQVKEAKAELPTPTKTLEEGLLDAQTSVNSLRHHLEKLLTVREHFHTNKSCAAERFLFMSSTRSLLSGLMQLLGEKNFWALAKTVEAEIRADKTLKLPDYNGRILAEGGKNDESEKTTVA